MPRSAERQPDRSASSKSKKDDEITDKFHLTKFDSRADGAKLLRYHSNKIGWYVQSIFTAHYSRSIALTQGRTTPDQTTLDVMQQGAALAAAHAPAALSGALHLSSYFFDMLKSTETETQAKLALAYASLRLTAVEFSFTTRLLTRKLDSEFAAMDVSQDRKSVV